MDRVGGGGLAVVGVSCTAESLLVHSSDFQSLVVLHERDDLAYSEYYFERNVSTLKKIIVTQKSIEKAVEKCT